MKTYKYFEASVDGVRKRVLWPLFLAMTLVPLTFLIPVVDSTRSPFFDLTSDIARYALWLSNSASVFWSVILVLALVIIMATRSRMSSEYRLKEALVLIGVTLVFAGGGSFLNEHYLKEYLEVPRPNIVWLAGEQGNGPLGMTPVDYYAIGEKQARQQPLAQALETDPVPMSEAVRNHWLDETGYSLPSGHSFAAFFITTFFLCIASTFVETRRRFVFYLLIPWAISVCYSRSILRLHTPLDISIGAIQGILLGIIGWLIARAIIRELVVAELKI